MAKHLPPRHLAIFITTATDAESDKVRDDPGLYKQLSDAMLGAEYPPADVPFIKFRIESQETVDRDYDGSWEELLKCLKCNPNRTDSAHHRAIYVASTVLEFGVRQSSV